jgi:hypothetical protein
MVKIIKALVLLFLVGTQIAYSQTENSPYSRYGLGDQLPAQNILSRSMGGISSAYYDYQSVNFNNPASYSRLRVTTFDFGVELDSRTLRAGEPPRKFNTVSPIISYIQLGIPLNKTRNWGMNLGLRPLTRISYEINERERLPGIDSILTRYEGNGGAYEVYAGTGKAFKDFSVGVNVGYRFGTRDYSTKRTFVPDSSGVFYYPSNHATNSSYGGLFVNGGVQYRAKLGKKMTLRIGANGTVSQTLNGTRDQIIETFRTDESGTIRIDSVKVTTTKGDIKYPANYAFGFILDYSDKWMIGADFSTTKWSEFRFFGETDQVQDDWKFHIGGQVIPNAMNARSYWGRVAYRAGFFYGRDYVRVDEDLPVYAFTFGAGLPLRRAAYSNQVTIINTSFEVGTRGNNDNRLRENFFKIGIGLTLSDIWFQKRKYD